MKKGIHLPYTKIEVVMTDGSTYNSLNNRGIKHLKNDIDTKSHYLWKHSQEMVVDKGGQLAKFNKRFGKKPS